MQVWWMQSARQQVGVMSGHSDALHGVLHVGVRYAVLLA